MSDKKVKPKRTPKLKEEKKTSSNVVWLYGTHNRIILKAAANFCNSLTEDFYFFRKELDIRLDTPVIPIFPDVRNRLDMLDMLEGVLSDMPKDTIILMVGQTEDVKLKRIAVQRKGDRYLFIHPSERQFYIDVASTMSYKKAIERKAELQAYLDTIFEEV